MPLYFNTDSVPLQAFKEVNTSGTGATGIYFSEDLVKEEWFTELRRLCHKRALPLFTKQLNVQNPEESKEYDESNRFSALADLANITNKYIAHKMTKNNFKKVHV